MDKPDNNMTNQNSSVVMIPIRKVYLYCFFVSLFLLLICTKSSPLYPMNDWVDANAFFTMGKGIFHGKVPYRDLFEQKGPLLYFIHAIAYGISRRSFLGVFAIEVISFSVFLFFIYQIVRLYCSAVQSLIAIPIVAFLVLNMRSFSHGDSAEEFCLPLMAYSMLVFLRYISHADPKPLSRQDLLIGGLFAGSVLWMKFSLLGYWLVWGLLILYVVSSRCGIRQGMNSVVWLGIGLGFSSLPWLIYFGVHQSIGDWIQAYFVINITGYAAQISPIERISYTLLGLLGHLRRNYWFSVLFVAGLAGFDLPGKKANGYVTKFVLLLSMIVLAIGVYGGGRAYIYYFLIFAPYGVFGYIAIISKTGRFFSWIEPFTWKAAIGLLMITVILSALVNQNTELLLTRKADLVQYRFAERINEINDPTLLNYGGLDYGFYTTTGIIPNIRFFQRQNMTYQQFPLMMDEQNRYIRDREVEFVVMRINSSSDASQLNIPYLYENYNLVMVDSQTYEWYKFTYLLFQLK